MPNLKNSEHYANSAIEPDEDYQGDGENRWDNPPKEEMHQIAIVASDEYHDGYEDDDDDDDEGDDDGDYNHWDNPPKEEMHKRAIAASDEYHGGYEEDDDDDDDDSTDNRWDNPQKAEMRQRAVAASDDYHDGYEDDDDEGDDDGDYNRWDNPPKAEMRQRAVAASLDTIISYGTAGLAAISGEALPSEKNKRQLKNQSQYVENGTLPMLIAKRFLEENHMRKYNEKLYLYNYKGIPCYSEISPSKLAEVVYNQNEELLLLKNPNFAIQICKAIKIQLTGISEDEVEEIESRYIATINAIIDLDSNGKFFEHTPDIFLRYHLNVLFDPDMIECPVFSQLINTITKQYNSGSKSILEMLAYNLFPTSFTKAFFVLIGKPNSGKSVITNFLQSFFPPEFVCNITLQDLGNKFSSGNIAEARINIEADLPDKLITEREVSLIKKITGGDRIMAEIKYHQGYSTKPKCKFLFASNHKLLLSSPDDAFINRLHIIPFDNSVPKDKQDPLLPEKLQAEITPIFTLLLLTYFNLRARNFMFTDCVDASDYCMVQSKSDNPSVSSVIQDFFEDNYEITGDASDFVESSELERVFSSYCHENHTESLLPGFTQRFKQFVVCNFSSDIVRDVRRGANKHRGYCGIRFKHSDQQSET